MDTPEKPKPWWRKKRWWAAAIVLAVASYPPALGPIDYCTGRGWVPYEVKELLFRPYYLYSEYLLWWGDLAREHNGRRGN